jgi:hypothetical protein
MRIHVWYGKQKHLTSGCYGLVTVGTFSALLHSVKFANCNQPQSHALWVLEVLIHIHTVVEDPDHNDLGFRASSVKDDMAALAELFVPRLYYVIRVPAAFLSVERCFSR